MKTSERVDVLYVEGVIKGEDRGRVLEAIEGAVRLDNIRQVRVAPGDARYVEIVNVGPVHEQAIEAMGTRTP